MQIKLIQSTIINGEIGHPGEIYDLREQTAYTLISANQAEYVEIEQKILTTKQIPQPQDLKVQHSALKAEPKEDPLSEPLGATLEELKNIAKELKEEYKTDVTYQELEEQLLNVLVPMAEDLGLETKSLEIKELYSQICGKM